ncbi:ATP-binding protein [Streptomyces sp. NPDC058371]|uniref:ATP-binding protein n=1 Tax=Streptomyces sp. NPDC058371 TaxID=3346463 RepID=UPI003664D1F0
MTTTAVLVPRAAHRRSGDVMDERLKVAPREGHAPPSAEDAVRVGVMRRIAGARLRYCGLEAMSDDVMLIVSELLTNAIQHSGTTEISLSIAVRGSCLRIAVRDGMPGAVQPQHPDDTAESGRGLLLVGHLVHANGGRWGISDAGAITWCCLPLPAGEQP